MTEEKEVTSLKETDVGEQLQECLEELNVNTIDQVTNEVMQESFQKMVNTVLTNFQKSIDSIKESAIKYVNELSPKMSDGTITDSEKIIFETAYSQLNGIKQLETNKLFVEYISNFNGNTKHMTNVIRIRNLEEKLIHRCRQHRVKKDNVIGTLDTILKISSPIYKRKMLAYYSCILNMLIEKKEEFKLLRHYIVFQLGAIRISARTYASTPFIEMAYSKIFNLPMPELIPFEEKSSNEIITDEMVKEFEDSEMKSDMQEVNT